MRTISMSVLMLAALVSGSLRAGNLPHAGSAASSTTQDTPPPPTVNTDANRELQDSRNPGLQFRIGANLGDGTRESIANHTLGYQWPGFQFGNHIGFSYRDNKRPWCNLTSPEMSRLPATPIRITEITTEPTKVLDILGAGAVTYGQVLLMMFDAGGGPLGHRYGAILCTFDSSPRPREHPLRQGDVQGAFGTYLQFQPVPSSTHGH